MDGVGVAEVTTRVRRRPRAASPQGASPEGAPAAVVYGRLRDLIVAGRLAPGARLVEQELASHFGVSRTPLRETLRRLEQEGYVARTPTAQQTRLIVAPMTLEDAHELFHVVGALEGLAAREAAALADQPRHALAASLRRTNEALAREAKSRRPDHNTLFELDERFHKGYVVAAAGARLRALHDAVKPQAERYERLYVSLLADELATSVQEHERIWRAIRDGRGADAQQAAQSNWRNAATRLAAVITRSGERGAWA
ncbi:MAG: GntR family transcriptional regulator [Gemmatimonadetes bacterium]|nr:GntR family transcriptional regulator [Gemmatimonadota bacterium]